MANEVRIIIQGDDRSDGAFRDARRSTERLEESLDEAADAATELGRAALEAGDEVEQALGSSGAAGAADELGDSADGAGGMFERLGGAGAVAGAAIGAAMAIGAAAVKALSLAINASIERSASLGRMKAQLLLTQEDAARYGKIAGEVYANNWGESLEEASNYVRDAALYIMPTPAVVDAAIAPSLRVVAERVAALAGTMEEDSKKVAVAIRTMLITGMAASADEAFNLLHAGIAKGVNSADDLLDTFIEYSTQFRQLGLDGQEAMGLLSMGLQDGARDADTVADGLKEIAIRAQDGSKASADAFKGLGLDAKKLGADFAAGGTRAREALDAVLDALRAVEDPMMQAQIAVGLFGTKAEDMQEALFGLDVTTATQALGDIANAADTAGAHLSGNAYSAIEAYQRKWQLFKADMGDKFLPVFTRVVGAIEAFADRVAPTVEWWLGEISKKWSENSESIEQFGELVAVVLGLLGESSIGAVLLGLDLVTGAIIAMGNAWSFMKQVFASVVMFILERLGDLIHGAALAFGWIPGIGHKLRVAEAEFKRFAADVNQDLAGINDKNVKVNVIVQRYGDAAPIVVGGTGKKASWNVMASGGTGSGLTMVGEHGIELVDLGASAKVYNNNQTRQMLGGAPARGSGAVASAGLSAAGNGMSIGSRAMIDVMRYMLNGPLRMVVDSSGRVRVA